MSGLPILVVDTSIFVSALFVGSAAAMSMLERIFHTALPAFCPETFAESEAKSHLTKFARYTTLAERRQSVPGLKEIAHIIQVTEMVRVCRDPKDDVFPALAKAVTADAVISGDSNPLIPGQFEGIQILTPGQWGDLMDADGQDSSGSGY